MDYRNKRNRPKPSDQDREISNNIRHLFVRVFNKDKRKFIRLIGEARNPSVVVEEENIINGKMVNGKYCLFDDVGTCILEIGLLSNADNYEQEDIDYIREVCTYKKIWKIRFSNSPLYLYGYNYFNSNRSDKNGYPIFSKYNPKIFYTKEYADEAAKKLLKFGYKVIVE